MITKYVASLTTAPFSKYTRAHYNATFHDKANQSWVMRKKNSRAKEHRQRAKMSCSQKDQLYEAMKRQLQQKVLTQREYEAEIRRICNYLQH